MVRRDDTQSSHATALATGTPTPDFALHSTDPPVFVDRAVALLKPLSNYARAELRMHEALGDLVPGNVRVEDIVDAALLEALRNSHEAPIDHLYPWLRRFARKVIAREVAQARRRRGERSLEAPVGTGWPDDEGTRPPRLIDILPDPTAPLPDQVVESAEFRRALATVLSQVPPSWREPFLLHAYQGLPLARVARLEGLPVREVRRRVEWTREFLRARLADEYDDALAPPTETLFSLLEQVEPTAEHAAHIRARLRAAAASGHLEHQAHGQPRTD